MPGMRRCGSPAMGTVCAWSERECVGVEEEEEECAKAVSEEDECVCAGLPESIVNSGAFAGPSHRKESEIRNNGIATKAPCRYFTRESPSFL